MNLRIKLGVTMLLLAAAVLLTGCSSVQVVAPNTSTITISTPQRRPAGLGFVVFPAGTYRPDFQTSEGIYYSAPTKLVAGAFDSGTPNRGGLFLPSPDRPNQHQAAWFDQQENYSVLVAAATSTTRLWRFTEPVSFTRP